MVRVSKLGVCISTSILEDSGMNPDLDTLATALYVRIDDLLADNPGWAPRRPRGGIAPKLSDAALITLAVISALLGRVPRRLGPLDRRLVSHASTVGTGCDC